MKARVSTESTSRLTPRLVANSPILAAANNSAFARCLLLGPTEVTTHLEKAATSSSNKRGRQFEMVAPASGLGLITGLYLYSMLGQWWWILRDKLRRGPKSRAEGRGGSDRHRARPHREKR